MALMILRIPFTWRLIRIQQLRSVSATRNWCVSQYISSSLLSTMPNESALKKISVIRREETKKWENSVPSTVYLEAMGNGYGSPRGLHVFADHKRYLFNCGEGVQRMAQEHKIKLVKFEHIFVTHNSWDNLGGLPGLTLTVQDAGVPRLRIHGPPKVKDIYDMTKGFLKVKHVDIDMHDYRNRVFEDGAFKITYVPLVGPKRVVSNDLDLDGQSEDENLNYYNNSPHKNEDASTKGSSSKRRKLDLQSQEVENISVAYICKMHEKSGQLLLPKCQALGIPIGPLLGQLKDGKDVKLPNGRLVRSQDVLSPIQPGPIFIVIECPTEEFLDPLLEAREFYAHQMTATCNEDFAEVVIHFTPGSLLQHPKYREWIERYSPSTNHLFLNEYCAGLSSVAASKIQHKLHLVHPEIFPNLACEEESQEQPWKKLNLEIPCGIFMAPRMTYHLRPITRLHTDGVLAVNSIEYVSQVTEIPTCFDQILKLQQSFSQLVSSSDEIWPQITFLGTGSSIPNKCRNVSAILLKLSPEKNVLLDCGEGTCDQIFRLYGAKETLRILKDLNVIFVSHLHADHHLGLVKLLLERRRAFLLENRPYSPVYLVAPLQIRSWLKSYDRTFQAILDDFRLVANARLYATREIADEVYKNLLSQAGLKELVTVDVLHCKHSFGIILTTLKNKKIVYSGDTMPCQALIDAGKNCDLLIHEATMEDDLGHMAKTKTHTTTSEAIKSGQQMNAKFTLLTHFSQRYSKIPLFNKNFHDKLGITFDNMEVSWKNIPLLSLFFPVLKLIFHKDYEEMEKSNQPQRRTQKPMLPSVAADK